MKHSLHVVMWLVFFFLISQVIGLVVISEYVLVSEVTWTDESTNQTHIQNETSAVELPNGIQRPEFASSLWFIGYLVLAIVLATILFLFLIKMKTAIVWKAWFFFAVFLCMTISLAPFVHALIATALAAALAAWKIFKPNVYIHNLTEPFVYAGIAALFVPIDVVTPTAMVLVLILISIYDMYAVWRSKHMITVAQFQAKSKVFAGLLIPYSKKKEDPHLSGRAVSYGKKAHASLKSAPVARTAILGGGDVAFPLLFAGAVLKSLLVHHGVLGAIGLSLIISAAAGIALFLLLAKGREDRFYPAMPFLSLGCFAGYAIVLAVA